MVPAWQAKGGDEVVKQDQAEGYRRAILQVLKGLGQDAISQ